MCGVCRGSALTTIRSPQTLAPTTSTSACRRATANCSTDLTDRRNLLIKDLRSQLVQRGRCKTRIRYPHRKCRQKDLSTVGNLTVATINVQGWNWHKLDDRNRDKAAGVLAAARSGDWDVACLSDMHCTYTDSHMHTGTDVVVALEEYLIVIGDKSAVLLSPAAQQAWREAGCRKQMCNATGRMMCVFLIIKGQEYAITSIYAPDQSKGTVLRKQFFDCAEEWRESFHQNALQLWAGDWNSHVGRDACSCHRPGLGRYALLTPTQRPGKELLQWVCNGPELDLADSFHNVWKRGTWLHRSRTTQDTTTWFELDVIFMTPGLRKRTQWMKTFALHFSDHFGKVCSISLGKAKDTWQEMRRRGLDTKKKPLKLKDMAGPLPEAVAKQERYRQRAEEL